MIRGRGESVAVSNLGDGDGVKVLLSNLGLLLYGP